MDNSKTKEIGRIEYLSCKGKVAACTEYLDKELMVAEIKECLNYGIPINIVLYKDDNGKTYFLYITAEGTDVKDKITFDDGVFEVEYLANCGIVLSLKASFRGDADDKEGFNYRVGKFLKDYI